MSQQPDEVNRETADGNVVLIMKEGDYKELYVDEIFVYLVAAGGEEHIERR